MISSTGLVFFATGWGSTKGGINAFNYGLCNALGKKAEQRSVAVFCICPGTTTVVEKSDAKENNVTLIDIDENDFYNNNFKTIVLDKIKPVCERIYWIGHDVITGEQAISCRDNFKTIDGGVLIFHHMNYAEYYAIGDAGRTEKGEEKVELQENLFSRADYAIAVGPKLFKSLKDICIKVGSDIKIGQVIPGLADIEPIREIMNKKIISFSGRLEKDNDPIKQFSIAIYAVGDLFKNNDAKLDNVELKLYGLDSESVTDLENKITEIKNKAMKRAGCTVPVKPLAYTSNRNKFMNEIRNSSINIMPSVSEGFGLAALESIAAGVPTIVTKNSGLYEFLENKGLNGYVPVIEIRGGIDGEFPNERDVNSAYNLFKQILCNYPKFKEKALELRSKLIEEGVLWESTAKEFLDFLNINELSRLIKLLLSFINVEIRKKYLNEFIAIAKSSADSFAEEISQILKIDKQLILSLKVDTILAIPDAIISTLPQSSLKNFFKDRIMSKVCEFLKVYFGEINRNMKSKNESEVVLKEFYTADKENIGEIKQERTNENVYLLDDKNFYDDVRNVNEDAQIDLLIKERDLEILKIYHNSLKKKYNVLNFEGLSVMVSSGVQNIPLDKVYASMNLKSAEDEFSIGYQKFSLLDPHKNKKIIIKGDPGSGKSTFLKKQLLSACDSDKKYMYMFFKVSEFSKWLSESNNSNKQLSNYIDEVLLASVYFKREIKTIYDNLREIGGVVYFIDGLDEVQDSEQKKKINQQIVEYVGEGENCRYFLTSRKVGLDEEFFKAMNFTIEEIAALSENSIKEYIKNWYAIVGNMQGNNMRDCAKQADKLIKSITSKNNSQLLSLAGNPLLLSIIVILHHHGINPPNNRTKLYGEITKTLLETWIEKRNFERKYPTEYITNFFSRVAFEIVNNDYNTMTIPEAKLKEMYRNYANEKNYTDDGEVDSFINYISGDAGIFSCQGELNGDRLYGFLMHRQITEYYAAIALESKINRNEIEFLTIINESKWTEVSILMGGYMSQQGEAGQDRVNIFIKKLFKTKSKPIEDFKYNILIILKWISNSTYIDKKNLQSMLDELTNLLKSSNRYRILYFYEDIVDALNNDRFEMAFSNCINELLEGDYNSIRNVSIIINAILKSREFYSNVLDKIPEEKLISALKQLIVYDEFNMLYRRNGCYNAFFLEYFVKSLNDAYKIDPEDNALKWNNYINVFASAVRDVYIGYFGANISKLIDVLENKNDIRKGTFDNNEFLTQYNHFLVLYTLAFDIAIDARKQSAEFDKFYENSDKWQCKKMLDSAKTVGKVLKDEIGFITSTYIDVGVRIYHIKNKTGHKLTILAYNDDKESFDNYTIILKNDFELEDVKEQVEIQKIPITVFNCLDQLSELEISDEEKEKIFNYAYNNKFLLTNSDWHQMLITKISQENDAFYKYYNILKKKVKFDDKKVNSGALIGEFKTYYKIFANQRNKITPAEIKRLVSLYKQENNEVHKNVIFDILYDLLHSESDVR